MTPMPEYLKRGDVMRVLGIGRRTLRGLISSGRLVPRRFHPRGRAVFARVEVDAVRREVIGELRNADCGLRNGPE